MSGEYSGRNRGPWWQSALCAQTDPEAFFPKGGGRVTDRAKAVCSSCEVEPECKDDRLQHAKGIEESDVFGYQGGMTAKQVNQTLGRRATQ